MDQNTKVFFAKFHEFWGKDKKKGLQSEKCADFYKVWVEDHQTKVFIARFHKFWGEDQKKKKVFHLKIAQIFTNSEMKTAKKGLYCKTFAKNSSCLRILGCEPLFWESQASNCTPVAPSLLFLLGHNSRLGGAQFSFEGAKAVIWRLGPGMRPPGAGSN